MLGGMTGIGGGRSANKESSERLEGDLGAFFDCGNTDFDVEDEGGGMEVIEAS